MFRVLTALLVGGLLALLGYGAGLLVADEQAWALAFGAAGFAIGVALSSMAATQSRVASDDELTKEK
jgi:hypothetical protein